MKFLMLSPGSSAGSLRYITSQATCLYHDMSTDIRYRITFKCPTVRGCFYSGIPGSLYKCASPYIEPVTQYMDIDKSGRYILNSRTRFHNAVLSGALICVGLKAKEFPFIAAIRTQNIGDGPSGCLIAVPIRSEDDITLKTITSLEWIAEELSEEEVTKGTKFGSCTLAEKLTIESKSLD